MDQNTEILNQIAAKSRELEMLNMTILQILKEEVSESSNAVAANLAKQEEDVPVCDTQLTAMPTTQHDPDFSVIQPRGNKRDLRKPHGLENSLSAEDSGSVTTPNRRTVSETLPSAGEGIPSSVESGTGAQPLIHNSSGIFRKPSSKYDRVRLYEEVWRDPMRTLALAYGVSGDALHKACRRLEVPTPPAGYWKRSASARQPVPRPELPKLDFAPAGLSRGYAIEERASILAQVAQEVSIGKNLDQACRNAGISYMTYRRWYSSHSKLVEIEAEVSLSAIPEANQGSLQSVDPLGVASVSQPQEAERPVSDPSQFNSIHKSSEEDGRTVTGMETNNSAVLANRLLGEGPSVVRVSEGLFRANDREALFREVWSKPMSEVARDHGVVSTTISRRCKQLHIPIPPAGHWLRLASGFPSQQQPTLPLIEIISKDQEKWKSNVYPFEEIIRISKKISEDVSTGHSLHEACRTAGIPISTYRRWSKRSTRFGDAFGLVEFLPVNRIPLRKHGPLRTLEEKVAILGKVDGARHGGELLHVALRKAGISVNSYHRWRAQLAK